MPVLSAVGHEPDVPLAVFAADVRAPTPSAAAEILSRDWSEWLREMDALRQQLERAVRRGLADRRALLTNLSRSYALREPQRVVKQVQQRVDELESRLATGLRQAVRERRHAAVALLGRWTRVEPRHALRRAQQRVSFWQARLEALGPDATLRRGFALVTDSQGKIVRRASQTQKGRPLSVRLSEGGLEVKVEATRPEGKKQS